MSSQTSLSPDATRVNQLLADFVSRTPGVAAAIAVSSDGLLMAAAAGLDRASTERLAALVSGMVALSDGASRTLGLGGLEQVLIEMRGGYLVVGQVGEGSSLAVLADLDADLGSVGYEMTLMVQRFGSLLTPSLVLELQGTVSLS